MSGNVKTGQVLCLLLLVAAAPGAQAGIVNMQSVLSTDTKDQGLHASINASADWRRGNVNLLFLGFTPVARYRTGKHLFIGLARAEHKSSGDQKLLSQFLEHLRYRYQLREHFLGETFVQHTYDAVRRLEQRSLIGAGPMFSLLEEKKVGVDLGISYMLEFERIRADELADAGNTDLAHRNSTYLIAHYDVDDRVQLVESLYYQPKLTSPNDYRILSDAQMQFRITSELSFNTAFSLSYDSRTPKSIRRLDTALTSSITIEI